MNSTDGFIRAMVAVADMGATAEATEAAKRVKRPKMPKLTATQRKLVAMLTENTGAAIMDSGGAYGRNWQRNLTRKLWEEPQISLNFDTYRKDGEDRTASVEVSYSTFHWLSQTVEFAPNMNRRFQRWTQRKDRQNECDLSNAEDFPLYLREKGHDVTGFYGEGDPITCNTYNEECLLDQTLQFVYFVCDNTPYVILQVHGGCDVRGGYTTPVVFEVTGCAETAIFDFKQGYIYPDSGELRAKEAEDAKQLTLIPMADCGSNVHWSTDDGYHWYYQGTCGRDYDDKQLEKMPAKRIAERSEWERGKVCVLPNGEALCPFTGCTLRASF